MNDFYDDMVDATEEKPVPSGRAYIWGKNEDERIYHFLGSAPAGYGYNKALVFLFDAENNPEGYENIFYSDPVDDEGGGAMGQCNSTWRKCASAGCKHEAMVRVNNNVYCWKCAGKELLWCQSRGIDPGLDEFEDVPAEEITDR